MNSGAELRLISVNEVLPLRQKVLRPLQSPEDCLNPEDSEATTFHVGLFYSRQLVSVASFSYQSCRLLNAGAPYRLRGMATDERYRGQGFGSLVMAYGQKILNEKRCDLLWCNARLKAFSFYQSVGFQFIGELFDIPGIGPHKVMYKIINPR